MKYSHICLNFNMYIYYKQLTFLKVRSYLLSGVCASRLKLEGGIHRLLLLDRERKSSLKGITIKTFPL